MRIIGIRPRRKQTVEGEARPTQVLIFQCDAAGKPLKGKPIKHDLANQQAEIDFILGRYPTSWVNWSESLEAKGDVVHWKPEHHFKWRRVKEGEDISGLPEKAIRRGRSSVQVVSQVASAFDGLSSGDQVAMILGGSGDSLAGSLANQGRRIGAQVFRIPPIVLKKVRDERGYARDDDAKLLAELFAENPDQFFRVDQQDQVSILVRECYRARIDAMKARIACEQRMGDLMEQRAFRELDPARSLQVQFDEAKANDTIMAALVSAEEARDAELLRALKQLPVYTQVVAITTGLGPSIGARLIAEIMDIRRFEVRPDQNALDESYRRGDHYKKMGRFQEDRHQVDVSAEGNGSREYRELLALARLKRQQNKHAEADYLDKARAEHESRGKMRAATREKSAAKLTAYLGGHVRSDGTFPRRRRGGVSNWSPDGRQGLYLFGEQLNYRPDSEWGTYMLKMKAEQRRYHPQELTISSSLVKLFRSIERYFGGGFGIRLVPTNASVRSEEELVDFLEKGREALVQAGKFNDGVQRKLEIFLREIDEATVDKKTVKLYTPAHILRMATWRTLTRFVVDFYHKWEKLDRRSRREEPMSAAAE